MGRDQAMIAIGIGCRRDASAAAIEELVRRVMAGVPAAGCPALFSIEDKAQEFGLIEAARRLGMTLTFLSRDDLRRQPAQTRSRAAEAAFGVPSVAEAAALAGTGPDARLLVARVAEAGVTCAVAVGAGVRVSRLVAAAS
jgi:cobalt-precorrin 5A hydrolase